MQASASPASFKPQLEINLASEGEEVCNFHGPIFHPLLSGYSVKKYGQLSGLQSTGNKQRVDLILSGVQSSVN